MPQYVMAPFQPSDWQFLAERASKKTDQRRLRAVVQLMIYALWQEQKHIKDDIQQRLDYRFGAMPRACVPTL
jgi:hypothetical protein